MLDDCGEIVVSATLSTTIPLVELGLKLVAGRVGLPGVAIVFVTNPGTHAGVHVAVFVTSSDMRQPC